ncbi:MAG TPA: cupin domain-containing protein [Sediminibacterium sp.]|nr:cupin domain-containing protein [Sediminibacterium sp.]
MPRIELKDIKQREMSPGFMARFIHTPNMTFSYLEVRAGASLPEHRHPQEQVAHVLEGEFQLTLDGEPIRFGPGTVIVIPSNVPHSGMAITDCKLLDVFHPIREDFLALSQQP